MQCGTTVININSVDFSNPSRSNYADKIYKNEIVNKYKDNVNVYYEYIQFTRAHFDCTNVEYNTNTGRISYMEFKLNGTIS